MYLNVLFEKEFNITVHTPQLDKFVAVGYVYVVRAFFSNLELSFGLLAADGKLEIIIRVDCLFKESLRIQKGPPAIRTVLSDSKLVSRCLAYVIKLFYCFV